MFHERSILAAFHQQPEGLSASWLCALIACMAVHRAQWSEALKQEVHVRFRNHCEHISVLSNVRPGPVDTEGGWREDDGDDEGRHAPFLSLSSATPTIQCGAMAKVTDLHNDAGSLLSVKEMLLKSSMWQWL